jgi:hypothetical protein
VNPTEREHELAVDWRGASLRRQGVLWRIAHSDPRAYNEPGEELNVVIDEKEIRDISSSVNLPPLSISLYKFPIRR